MIDLGQEFDLRMVRYLVRHKLDLIDGFAVNVNIKIDSFVRKIFVEVYVNSHVNSHVNSPWEA